MTSAEMMGERREILFALASMAKELLAQDPIDVASALELAHRSAALVRRWPVGVDESDHEQGDPCPPVGDYQQLMREVRSLNNEIMQRLRVARGQVLERMQQLGQRKRQGSSPCLGVTYRL